MNKGLRRKVKKIRPQEKLAAQEIKQQENTDREQETVQKKEHHVFRNVMLSISAVVCTVGVFFAVTSHWAFETWPDLGIEEMLFQLTNNVAGTGGGILHDFVMKCAVPSIVVCLAVIVCAVLVRKHRKAVRNACILELCGGLVLATLSVHTFYVKADVKGYLEAQNSDSNFIEENYVDPADTEITFPEKRNLIYIFLESMEMTFADEENGGGFDYNCIPELTEMAEENECFAGNTGKLNGAHAYENAHYTSAAMFAQTSGLPLQLNEDIYYLNNHDVFYPGISTIGTILKDQGYTNTLLFGSNGDFGNRAAYFENHGDYEIRDYYYAVDHGWIPSDYRVWWGYEDEKLFANARTTLDELSSSDQPFNLTMLTVDTHFEDGYVCDLCPDEFDTQYANVMACSSKQVKEFIDWCKTQDWYDNTTIVINGDHNTMDSDFCNDVDASYDRRTYTCYINAAVEPADPDKERVYSTQDNFPTTLAAMGCQIKGDRLGLGTNLFSDKETLSEKYGTERVNQEMRNKSEWLVNQSNVSSVILSDIDLVPREDDGMSVYVSSIRNLRSPVKQITVTSDTEQGSTVRSMTDFGSGVFGLKLSADECNGCDTFHIRIRMVLDDGTESIIYERQYSPDLRGCDTLGKYVSLLKDKNCDVLMASKYNNKGLSGQEISLLRDFGFSRIGSRTTYTGALTENGVDENKGTVSGAKVELSGTLSCGHPYELISSGGTGTDIAGISVDGLNCAMNETGLSIAAVDRETGYILDSACYNPETGELSHK